MVDSEIRSFVSFVCFVVKVWVSWNFHHRDAGVSLRWTGRPSECCTQLRMETGEAPMLPWVPAPQPGRGPPWLCCFGAAGTKHRISKTGSWFHGFLNKPDFRR